MHMCCIQAYLKMTLIQKKDKVTVVKQDDDFHVVKDNESVWAGVNYSDSTQTFIINNTKVEVKAKGMFVLKKKDDNTYECSFYNPNDPDRFRY